MPGRDVSMEIISNKAGAPYNFVPLNDTVISGEKVPDGDRYYDNEDRITGYISYELETLTPLFIGKGSDNTDQTDQTDQKVTREFFSPAGKVRIPGSSLRGMIRTMVEIVSWGKFGATDKDRKLYFRAVGEKGSLGKHYRKVMLDENDHCFPRIKAGLLIQIFTDKYIISPSANIYRVQFDIENRKAAKSDIALQEFDFKKIYFIPAIPKTHTHFRLDKATGKKKPFLLKYAEVTEVSESEMNGYKEGFLISSGNLGIKKHMHWIIDLPDFSKQIPIDAKVIDDYRKDVSRDDKSDLFRRLDKDPGGVPCFYITDTSGKVFSFGFTGMFRLAYDLTIGDHIIPQQLLDDNLADITENVFGTASMSNIIASRVFFEDAVLISEKQYDSEVFLNLLSPKPTTFQHYLEQEKNVSKKELKHWNHTGAKIRGYKLYWHKNIDLHDKTENKKLGQKIRPIKHGTFKGKIRFENLTKIELGTLLFALDLPSGLHHKLGMGKPCGFGSVKISPRLFVSNRKERYRRLFENSGWYLAEKEEKDKEKYKQEFQKYILEQLKLNKESLWDIDRMKELSAMLNYSNIKLYNWLKNYMPLKRFEDRLVLPLATEVANPTEKQR
jgi:CRISPR-associated protein (TIGR03986 family)